MKVAVVLSVLASSFAEYILYNTFQMLENKLLLMRTKKNLTQEELAKAVEVTRQTIIAIEKGNYTPSVLLALRIAKFFNVKVEDIFIIKYEQ